MKVKKIEVLNGEWRDNVAQLVYEDDYDAVVAYEKGNEGCHIYTRSTPIILKMEKDIEFEKIDLVNGIKSYYCFASPDYVMGWMRAVTIFQGNKCS